MEMRVAAGRWTPLLLLATLLLASNLVSGSHFRYGTMSWRPIDATDTEVGQTILADPILVRHTVAFEFKAAYRRDYEWGKFFREQYRPPNVAGGTQVWKDGGSCYTEDSCSVLGISNPSNYMLFPFIAQGFYVGWEIKLAVGRSYFELNVTGPNANDELSDTRRPCVSPFDTGDKPLCRGGVPSGTQYPTTQIDPTTNCVGSICAGSLVPYEITYPDFVSALTVPCEQVDDAEPDYCSPWSQTYGFFFGDSDTTGIPLSTDVVLEITEMNYEVTNVGNYLLGTASFYHTYQEAGVPKKKKDDFTPWTAYFTGGNRLTYSTDRLINNHQGRFRLELTVNLNYPDLQPNNSPVMTALPVLPVPYTGRSEISANGVLATFQVSGFDPDIDPEAYKGNKLESNEAVYYFLGSQRKMGMLLANQVPDLKFPSRWFRAEYEEARRDCYLSSCIPVGGVADPFILVGTGANLIPAGVNLTVGQTFTPDPLNAAHNAFATFKYEGTCSECAGGNRTCTQLREEGPSGITIETPLNFTCELYEPWDNNVNLAHQPERLYLDRYTGVVQWETGINPRDVDNATYVTDFWNHRDPGDETKVTYAKRLAAKGTQPSPEQEPLQPGFYNVVFDVRSYSHDPDCHLKVYDAATLGSISPHTGKAFTLPAPGNGGLYTEAQCKAVDDENMIDIAYVSVPLDFLLFLYPPASWCSKSKCRNTQAGITTFRDEGFYGTQNDVNVLSTGSCTICGGGEWNLYDVSAAGLTDKQLNLTDYTVCLQDDDCKYDFDTVAITPAIEADICKRNTPPKWVDQASAGNDDGNTPTPRLADRPTWSTLRVVPSDPTSALASDPFIDGVPIENVYPGLALFLGQRSSEVRFNLTAVDEDDCVEMQILPIGLFRGYTMYNLDTDGVPTASQACSYASSFAGNDGNIGSTCPYNMKLEFIKRIGTTNQFYRTFVWSANNTLPQVQDPRPPNVVVCFIPFDNYQVGIRRCVNIILLSERFLYWIDARAKLTDVFSGTNDAFNTIVEDCNATRIAGSNENRYQNPCHYTPADLTTFYVSPNHTLEFYMTALQDSGNPPIGIYITEGGNMMANGQVGPPEGATFEYLEFNDTSGETFKRDPAKRKFSWTPTEGQQCKYVLCFRGNNTRDLESAIDYTKTFTNNPDERCYTIVVADQQLALQAGSFVDAAAALPSLTSDCGMTFSMWFFPEGTTTMPLATFGYTKPGEADKVLYMLEWDPVTAVVFHDGITVQDLGQYYRLKFSTGQSYIIQTEAEFCVNEWHFLTFTIAPNGNFVLYLDGVETTHYSDNDRDFHVVAVETGSMPVVDGKVEIIGDILNNNPGYTGFLRIGSFDAVQTFNGMIGDVRIYSRVLTAEEIGAKQFVPLTATSEVGLEAYYKFNDGSQADNTLGNSVGQFNKYRALPPDTADSFCNLAGDTYCNNVAADSPAGPSETEMKAKGQLVTDLSGNGNHAAGCGPDACSTTSTMYFVFAPSPITHPCPEETLPTVVHVDGGNPIFVAGTGFARSQWLKCSFSMSDGSIKVIKAVHNTTGNISCVSPGSPDLTVSALEVTNGGVNFFTNFQLPIYMMERVVSLSTDTENGKVTIKDACDLIGTNLFSMGAWVYPLSQSGGALEDVISLNGMTSNGQTGLLSVRYNGARFVVYEKIGSTVTPPLGESSAAPAHNMGEGSGWHYVMLSGNTDRLVLYMDGESTELTATSISLSTCDLELGTTTTGRRAFFGYVEELSAFSGFLEACDAYQIMWGNFTRFPITPVGETVQKTAATVSPVNRALYLRFNGPIDPNLPSTVPDQSANLAGYNGILDGAASLLWTTVPFLKPSFNRRRPRVGPPVSDSSFVIEGPNSLMTENKTFPRKHNDFYEHAYLPGEELMETGYGEKSTIRMQVDGRKNLNILGFGFAESKWLKCSFDGERVPAKYVSIDEVTCDIPPVENPGMYSLGVMNLYPDFADKSCVASHNTRNAERGSPAAELVAFVDDIELAESSLSFDGVNDYAMSQPLAEALQTPSWTGVTFGGWFMPKNTNEDKEQPILCFATKCEQVAPSPPPPSPPPPSPPPDPCLSTETNCEPPPAPNTIPPPPAVGAPPIGGPDFTFVSGSIQPYAQFCLMYKNGSVYLYSQLTSNTYNDLYFNTTTAVPVEAGHWHYAEITIDGTEISPMINSDSEAETGNVPTYIATMIVDNVTYDGSMDNGDFRVAVHPESLGNGTFFVGGLGCDMLATEISMENFEGLIDEVRVFKGVHRTEWFARLDIEKEQPLAYFRMSTLAGESQNLYSLTPNGNLVEDFSGNGHHLTFYEFETDEKIERKQTYVFEAAPWEAASTRNIMDMTKGELDSMMMDADQTVIVEGYNVADTQWLRCLFYSANVTGAKTVEIVPLPLVEAEYVNNTLVKCKPPPSHLPIVGYVQIANPRANELAEYTYMESALEFEGDMLKNMEIIGGTANAGESVDLMCPAGMRMDKVMFASYGRPMNRCNFKQETECDNSKTDVPCDYLQYEVNEECHSDTDKPPYWTIDRVEKICYGKSSCSIAALDSVFGDPCPSMNKWFEVAMRCSDRWTTKDYLQADEVTSQLTTGEYTFGAWVYPHSKPGVQSIVSFGAAMDSSSDVLNNAILQWRGDEGGNTGRFYYYDDCVYDVLMKYPDGRDIVVASHQWYQVFLTRSKDGVMRMYLNGHEVANWNSVCAPDPEGTFILGMDLSDEMYPKEFFDGLLDEVVVYNRELGDSEIQTMMCWSNKQDLAPDGLVVYYRFNRDLGADALALDESPFLNHGHLAQSSDNLWSNETGMFGSMTPTIHTSYTYMGVPWFPASTYSAHVQPMGMMGAMEGELVGGQEVTIKGLNFAPRVSRVFYDDKEIVYEFVDMTTMTATIPNIKEAMDSVSADAFELELSVVNSLPAEASDSCPAGSGSMQEDDVTFTQQLGVRDLQHGLVCYFPFLGSAEDYSGGAKHGTVVGASHVANRDHYPEQAMQFDAEEYVEISGCEGRTVAMWINYDDLKFPLPIDRNNMPFEAYEPETGCQTSELSTQNNAWLFVVGILNDDLDLEMMYLNGVANTNHKLREQVLSILVDKKIGGDDFVGKIDDVWIWDRELTLAEIGSLFRTNQYALEFGYGTEMHMEMSMEAQGPPGLLAKYYGAGIEYSEIQETMSKSYSTNSPLVGVSADDWSLELTGYIYAPFSQEYIFSVKADDSFRLWINTGSFTVDLEAGTDWGGNGPAGAADGTNWVSVINEPCQGGVSTASHPCCGCPTREVQGNIELYEGWYEIYFSYSDKSNAAEWELQWQTTDGIITKQLIPKQYLRAGTGPTIMEAWVYPYRVDGDHAIASQSYFGELNGASFGIYKGGVFASVYIGCLCRVPKCDEYRTVRSWKAPVVANAWQHIFVMYDGTSWTLKVDGVLDDSFNFLNTRNLTSFTSNQKFFAETRSPLVFGRENSKEIIVGSPDDTRMFYGLIYNFAKWGNPPTVLSRRCPLDGDENGFDAVGDTSGKDNLMVYLMLNEGVGLKAYDQSGNGLDTSRSPNKEYYKDAVITPPPSPLPMWVNATFLPRGNAISNTEITGAALEEAIAGKCAVVSIQSFDECGHKRIVGGDPYVMEVTGPLHLNTETILLTVGDGIEDMMDGSYVATFSRNVSGYYQIKVCNCSCDDAFNSGTDCQGALIHKSITYVHPYIANSTMSYIYDTEDALYLNEVNESMAGLPVEFKLQTVDMYGNLRTTGGITDWALEFNGPQNFFGDWKDNNNGSYTFAYTAHVAGDYRMQVRMFDEPICASGGNTCSGGTRSDYEFCTLAITPPDPTNTCQQCVKVLDGSSLNFEMEASVPTVFPDMDALDLEGNFTVYAFIRKGEDSGEAREYILSKQSEYSGKGYWLALVPTVVAGEYTLEGGVYVGGENFRIGKATVTLEMKKWAHVAMTYDGMSLKLYLDTVLVEDASFDDEMPKFNRRNSQPVRVGKGFSGQIDNVMIWNTTREFNQFVPDSFCPAFGPEMMLQDLVAYYRFNENDGIHTKDSSHLMNDGVVGLICDMTPVGHNVHLACPTGYMIGEVLYANFGDNDGSCGNYEMGTCEYAGSMSLVETACVGVQSCMVNANATLDPTCLSTTKSLAVNAVCVKSDDMDKAAWSLQTAPTSVGVTVAHTDHIMCAYDLMTEMGAAWSSTSTSTTVLPAVPKWISAHLNNLTKQTHVQCSTAEGLATVTAGVPVVFALLAKDGCGYRSMNEMDVFKGALVYPNLPNLTAMAEEPTCPDFPTTPHAEVPLNVKNGPDVLGYCNAWGDLYVMQFTPVTTGVAKIELMLNGELVMDHEVVVSWGFLSDASTAKGSGLISAEAGVESMFEVHAKDKHGNLRMDMEWGDEDHIMVNVTGAAMAASRVERSDHMGIYNVFIMYPVEGAYHVEVMVRDMLEEETFRTIHEGETMVHGSEIRPVTGLNIEFPEARFEHSMVAYDDELFIFGGARPDKTYLDSMLKYDVALGESNPAFYSYRRKIEVENMVDEAFTVELTLDTEALIESGKLKMDCADLRFYNTDGAALALWVEPGMSPGGCGSAHTTVWIRVPGGMHMFYMYYGNKAADSMSDPMSVFEFFEDFEYETSPLENGWQLSDASTDTCTTEDGFNPGDAASFYTSEVTSMTGSRALRADTMEKMGGSLFKEMPTMGKFTMKVFMYDMLCPGAHWVSPDFKVCTPQADMKTMLPSRNTGVGVYTASSNDTYCALYPWKTTGVSRALGWHSFTMRDDDDSLSVIYDVGSENESKMELRSDDITTDISKVFIRAARLPGDATGSSAFWDSVIVTPYNADISVSHDEEEVVVYNPEATWATVGATSPPPARQAHSAVVYDEAMYVFGGERSAYEYSDVWKYDFKEDTWAFQAPVNRSAALGRHDHSAVVYKDAMYVYGGRSPSPRDDFWKYDFRTREWVPMPTSPKMSARFGHGAAVHDDIMYVFGGWTEEENMLTNEIWEFDFHDEEWTKVGPRKVNFESTVDDPTDAIVFPQQIPSPRFPQDVIITGMMPAMYVVGGVGGDSMMEELPELWKFDLESKTWTLLATHPLLGRTDGAAALLSKGDFYKHVMLYGGRANGKVLGDLVTMFVGETGTGKMMMTARP